MLSETKTTLKQLLFQTQGYKRTPYLNQDGVLTVGIGRNLADRGISLSEAYIMLENDIDYFDDKLRDLLDFYCRLSPARQAILIDMCFSLGVIGLLKLKDMLRCLSEGEYECASRNMLMSDWAKISNRAQELAKFMALDMSPTSEA